MRIWKKQLKLTDEQVISIPKGAKILTAQIQYGQLQLWFLCDGSAELEDRTILIVGTGNPIPDAYLGDYIGTVQECDGRFVWHIFEGV